MYYRNNRAKKTGTSGPIIGRYERNEMTPSIEIAAKIAGILEVSLDYLVGNSNLTVKDQKVLKRLESIENMPSEEKKQIFSVVDALIRDYQAKKAYSG